MKKIYENMQTKILSFAIIAILAMMIIIGSGIK